MEVLVGPTFGIDVSSAAGYVRARSSGEDPNGVVAVTREIGSSLGMAGSVKTPLQPVDDDESSESSSSIGAPGDTDDDDDDEDEVDSSKSSEGKFGRKFGSFGSLEDALPIKRGLSNHFTGKSKSFANLAEVSSFNVKEVEKQENPFNKRRRILIQSRLARKRFYSSFNPKSMPLLPVDENDTSDRDYSDQDEQDRQDEKDDEVSSSSSSDEKERQHNFGRGQQMQQFRLQRLHDRKLGTFKSHSCFALSDLQEEEDL